MQFTLYGNTDHQPSPKLSSTIPIVIQVMRKNSTPSFRPFNWHMRFSLTPHRKQNTTPTAPDCQDMDMKVSHRNPMYRLGILMLPTRTSLRLRNHHLLDLAPHLHMPLTLRRVPIGTLPSLGQHMLGGQGKSPMLGRTHTRRGRI